MQMRANFTLKKKMLADQDILSLMAVGDNYRII